MVLQPRASSLLRLAATVLGSVVFIIAAAYSGMQAGNGLRSTDRPRSPTSPIERQVLNDLLSKVMADERAQVALDYANLLKTTDQREAAMSLEADILRGNLSNLEDALEKATEKLAEQLANHIGEDESSNVSNDAVEEEGEVSRWLRWLCTSPSSVVSERRDASVSLGEEGMGLGKCVGSDSEHRYVWPRVRGANVAAAPRVHEFEGSSIVHRAAIPALARLREESGGDQGGRSIHSELDFAIFKAHFMDPCCTKMDTILHHELGVFYRMMLPNKKLPGSASRAYRAVCFRRPWRPSVAVSTAAGVQATIRTVNTATHAKIELVLWLPEGAANPRVSRLLSSVAALQRREEERYGSVRTSAVVLTLSADAVSSIASLSASTGCRNVVAVDLIDAFALGRPTTNSAVDGDAEDEASRPWEGLVTSIQRERSVFLRAVRALVDQPNSLSPLLRIGHASDTVMLLDGRTESLPVNLSDYLGEEVMSIHADGGGHAVAPLPEIANATWRGESLKATFATVGAFAMLAANRQHLSEAFEGMQLLRLSTESAEGDRKLRAAAAKKKVGKTKLGVSAAQSGGKGVSSLLSPAVAGSPSDAVRWGVLDPSAVLNLMVSPNEPDESIDTKEQQFEYLVWQNLRQSMLYSAATVMADFTCGWLRLIGRLEQLGVRVSRRPLPGLVVDSRPAHGMAKGNPVGITRAESATLNRVESMCMTAASSVGICWPGKRCGGYTVPAVAAGDARDDDFMRCVASTADQNRWSAFGNKSIYTAWVEKRFDPATGMSFRGVYETASGEALVASAEMLLEDKVDFFGAL